MTKGWTIKDIPPQTGRRYLITGANSGIGFWTAVELATRGAVVVMACRDVARGQAALARLRQEATGPESAGSEAELVQLDLASLASIRRVADSELASGRPLHGLINNAGVFSPPQRRLTEDGFELQFGTNVLGHFDLTCRLLPALELAGVSRAADAPRVITLASIAHRRARIRFDDLQAERSYSGKRAYYQSKLADLMFAFELERRLRARGSAVVSIAAHPGVAQTNLFKIGSSTGMAAKAERAVQWLIAKAFNDEHEGALPTLFAATSPAAEGGGYYGPQGFQEMRGGDVGPARVAARARDVQAQARLWRVCEELTGVSL